MALLLVVAAAVVAHRLGRGRSLSAFILFPRSGPSAGSWSIAGARRPGRSGRPEAWGGRPRAGSFSGALGRRSRGPCRAGDRTRAAEWRRAWSRRPVIVAVAGLARLAPGYLNPHYSIREASRDLAVRLGMPPDGSAPRRARCSSATTAWPTGASSAAASLRISRFPGDGRAPRRPAGVLGRDYALIHVYSIHISPEYIRSGVSDGGTPESVARSRIRVYRRISPGDLRHRVAGGGEVLLHRLDLAGAPRFPA